MAVMPARPTEPLSLRQEDILHYVRETIAARGEPPTLRQIGRHVGLPSVSAVHYQVSELQRKGVLVRDPRMPRSIRLL